MKKLIIILLCLGLIVPVSAKAAQVLVNKGSVFTKADVEDDLYAAGESVSVVNRVGQDLVAAGQKVEVEEGVAQDVVALGQLVRVRGTVGDDVYAAGEDVEVNSPEVDDVFVAGANVTIAQKARVKGNLYAAGQKITIMGRVEGTVRAAGEVVVTQGAVISGDLITRGPNEPVVEEGATVAGAKRHTSGKNIEKVSPGAIISRWVQSVVSWFVFGMLLLYLFRNSAKKVVATVFNKSGKSLGWGFLWLVLFLPAVILSMILVVSLPIGMAVLITTILIGILAMASAPIVVGAWTNKYLFKREGEELKWQHVLLGAIVYQTVSFVPIIGWLIVIVVLILIMGSWIQVLWQLLRGNEKGDEKLTSNSI